MFGQNGPGLGDIIGARPKKEAKEWKLNGPQSPLFRKRTWFFGILGQTQWFHHARKLEAHYFMDLIYIHRQYNDMIFLKIFIG